MEEQPHKSVTPDPLLNQKEVRKHIPIGESSWFAKVAAGIYPPPIKVGRRSFWKLSTIQKIRADLEGASEAGGAHDRTKRQRDFQKATHKPSPKTNKHAAKGVQNDP